jgi:hypothetical protein
MNTTRMPGLWQAVRAFLLGPVAAGIGHLRREHGSMIAAGVILVVFAAGVGAYAASRALWPFLLVWWSWLLAGAAAVAALGAWWLWWRLPKRQVDRLRLRIGDPKARADVEDNFRKTVGQLLGGAAAHDLLISNQVAKGFELLGNKDNQIQQRLGGIYALEGVMNTSKEYYQPVLEALSAFIRDRAAETSEGAIGTDIQGDRKACSTK